MAYRGLCSIATEAAPSIVLTSLLKEAALDNKHARWHVHASIHARYEKTNDRYHLKNLSNFFC